MPAIRKLDLERAVDHLPRLFRAARGLTRTTEEAEDLVQETYARVFAKTRYLRGDELGYLLKALRNTLTSQRRAEGRRVAPVSLVEEQTPGGRDDPADTAELHEIQAIISELPDEFREAIVAVDIVGLSYREAARALGVAQGTLTSRLFRGRDRVANQLSEAGRRPE